MSPQDYEYVSYTPGLRTRGRLDNSNNADDSLYDYDGYVLILKSK